MTLVEPEVWGFQHEDEGVAGISMEELFGEEEVNGDDLMLDMGEGKVDRLSEYLVWDEA